MANNSKKNVNLVRVISEYYMMKKVLGNEYSHDILTGAISVSGQNGAADKMTLLEMKKYVDQLGEMKISANGLGKAETFDAFMERLMKKYLSLDVVKSMKQQNEISENPFDESFSNLVSGALDMENAKSRIEVALQVNPQIVEKISSLPILLGGKKQSSYVRLLSQCTDLFSSVSGLENQIKTLTESGKAKDADIARLTAELEEQRKKAAEYKDMIDKALAGMGKNTEETKVIIGLLEQTRGQLDIVSKDVAVQGRATRIHVSREADRVIENVGALIYEKDKVRKQIFDHPTLYPTFIACYSGRQLNVKKELPEALSEIRRAATSTGFKSTAPVVDSLYNDLNETNLGNGKQPASPKKKGGRFVKVASILVALAIGAGGALGIAHATGNFPANDSGEVVYVDAEYQNYQNYQNTENQQLNDYMDKLSIALQDGTLVSFDQYLNNPDFQAVSNQKTNSNGVWTAETLQELRNQYAQDDQIEKYGWSSTGEIDAETRAAVADVQADFYESNYALLLSQVSGLNDQIDKLTADLNQANADKAALQAQIDALQAQIDDLQAIIDAAENKYDADTSELQAQVDALQEKVDEANEKISQLEQENADLAAENAELKSQINSLDNQIAELQDLIANLRYENSVLSTEKASLKSKVASLENQIKELQGQVSGSDSAELQAQVAELTQALEEANKTIDSLQSTNEALTQQIVELQGSISELNSDVANLEEAVKNLSTENSSLKSEVTSLESSLSQSMNEYNQLLEQYKALVNSGGNPAEVEALKAELNSAYSLINAYESKIVSLYNEITSSATTNAEAMQNLENLLNMFGINYSENANSSSNSSSEYQPGLN